MGKYEETLERAREIYANPREALKDNVNLTNEGSVAAIKVALLDLFPMEEIAESEDERIRKFLIQHISEWIGCIEHDLKLSSKDVESEEELAMFKACLAYLEQQKEQKPEEKISVSEELYEHIRNACACIDDAMSSDTMCDMTDYLEMANSSAQKAFDMVERLVVKKPAEWSTEDEKTIHLACEFIRHHATSNDSIDGIDCSELVGRLKSLRPQPKQEWSEEDSKRYVSIRTTLETSALLSKEDYDANVVWLRDLVNAKKYSGHKPSWKPSEEQMKAMEEVRTIFHNHHLWDEINPILYDYEELMRDLQKLI